MRTDEVELKLHLQYFVVACSPVSSSAFTPYGSSKDDM